ncbi:hypothetical protein DWH45_26935 [Escherichia coli]|nr:hypothetical protein [Escherichia coli]
MQREKPPEWREKQKGSRGIRRGQRYRLVFQFPIRQGGACQALRRADAVLVNATIFDRLISTELSGMVSIRSQFFHRSSLPPVITRLCL